LCSLKKITRGIKAGSCQYVGGGRLKKGGTGKGQPSATNRTERDFFHRLGEM